MNKVQEFEELRPLLFSIAYRILGSVAEAEDAVQETWLRSAPASRAGGRGSARWPVRQEGGQAARADILALPAAAPPPPHHADQNHDGQGR